MESPFKSIETLVYKILKYSLPKHMKHNRAMEVDASSSWKTLAYGKPSNSWNSTLLAENKVAFTPLKSLVPCHLKLQEDIGMPLQWMMTAQGDCTPARKNICQLEQIMQRDEKLVPTRCFGTKLVLNRKTPKKLKCSLNNLFDFWTKEHLILSPMI